LAGNAGGDSANGGIEHAGFEVNPPADPAELAQDLRGADDAKAWDAIISLAETSEITVENLQAIMALLTASECKGPMYISPAHFEYPRGWKESQTRGAFLAARMADKLRDLPEEDKSKAPALAAVDGFFIDAIDHGTPGLTRKDAFAACFRTGYCPVTMYVESGARADAVIGFAVGHLHDDDAGVREVASRQLYEAALLTPSRSEELLGYLRGYYTDERLADLRKGIDETLRKVEELVPMDEYLTIRNAPDEDLSAWLEKNAIGGGTRWNLYFDEVRKRLLRGKDRTGVLADLLNYGGVAYRLVPATARPISEDASSQRKAWTDRLIAYVAESLDDARAGVSEPQWAVMALERMLVAPNNRSNRPDAWPVDTVWSPYEKERVLYLLTDALSSDAPGVQRDAAYSLSTVCWLDGETAQSVLDALRDKAKQMEDSGVPSKPDEGAFPEDFSKNADKIVYRTVVGFQQQVEEALDWHTRHRLGPNGWEEVDVPRMILSNQ